MNLIILILGLLSAFGPLSIDMYLPALPDIATDLMSDQTSVQLSLASFFVGIASGQLFYGPITDKFGRKKPLYFGLALYAIASFLCATASTVDGLVFFRFLQALGACAGIVISRAVVRDLYQPHESAKIFSLLMLIMGAAPILAPVMGGVLLNYFGWRAIFWLLTIISCLTLGGVFFFLKETSTPSHEHQLRKTFSRYLEVLSDKNFSGYTLSLSFVYAGMFAYITASSFVFMKFFNLTSSEYSMLFGVNAFGLIAFSQVNGQLLKKYHPRQLIRASLPLTFVSGICLVLAALLKAPLWGICVPLFFYMMSMGMIAPNAAACALAHQKKSAGSASAMMGTIQFTVSAVVSGLVSKFHDGTPLPMTIIMAGCAVLSVGCYFMMVHRRHQSTPSSDSSLILNEK